LGAALGEGNESTKGKTFNTGERSWKGRNAFVGGGVTGAIQGISMYGLRLRKEDSKRELLDRGRFLPGFFKLWKDSLQQWS